VSEKEVLVIFDFDGTITFKDTLLEIIKYIKGRPKFYIGFILLFPLLICYKLGLIKNWRAKEYVLSYFFKGENLSVFNSSCTEFSLSVIPTLCRKKALDQISTFQKQGYRIIIVTASAENWVKPWSDRIGVELISTKLEVKGDKITGKIHGKNCHGEEKVRQIAAKIDITKYSSIIAYGDSESDKALNKIVTKFYYKAL